jgi:hypothetical protein
MSDGTLVIVLRALNGAVQPLANDLATPADALRLLRSLGLNVDQPLQSIMQLVGPIQTFIQSVTDLEAAITNAGGDETSPQVIAAVKDVGLAAADLFAKLKVLAPQIEADLAAFPAVLAEFDSAVFAKRLVHYLAVAYLRDLLPPLYNLLAIFGIVEEEAREASGETIPPHVHYELRFDRLKRIPRELPAVLGEVYGWGTTDFRARRLLERIQYLALSLGFAPVLLDDTGGAGDGAIPELHFSLFSQIAEAGAVDVGLELGPATLVTPPGLALRPYAIGKAEIDFELRPRLILKLEGEFDASGGLALELDPPLEVAFKIGPAAGGTLAASAGLNVQWGRESGDRVVVFNLANLLILDFDGIQAGAQVKTDGSSIVLDILLGVVDGAFTIQTGDSDGFLAKILPPEGIRAPFDIAIGWNSKTGVYFRGSGGFEVTLPVRVELGPIVIEEITLALRIGTSGVTLEIGVTALGDIGPVAVAVQNVGFAMLLEFKSGNLGPVNLTPKFKFPTAVGLAIDAGPVAGGGFISFDEAHHRYSGILHVEILAISVTIIGIIETKLPDGRDGFSFLLIVCVEFSPIQLGYGFSLNGVGGLAGIHRGMNLDALRTGVYTGSLDHILFPQDPIANAPQLISDLSRIFPVAENSFTFGPMAKIGWGASIITISLGIVIQLPSPIRIALLGQIGLFLPEPEDGVVELHIDFVASIDFEAKLLALDATLRDSRIVVFTLTGDMAMRLSWGDQPNFTLAMGGFHPHFPTPPGFPSLRRLQLALGAGDYIRLNCQTYQAVTSNSLQLGARLELFVDVGVNIHGWLGFDVLMIFSPFSFQADFSAGLSVSVSGVSLASVTVEGSLTGPTPWRVRGEAKISLLFFECTARVDEKFGRATPATLAPVDPWPDLLAATEDARNWSALLATGVLPVVSLAAAQGDLTVLIDPGGRITWLQHVVPLDRQLTKYQNAPIASAVSFTVDRVTVGATSVKPPTIDDLFPAGQFQELSDSQKLSRPSFEKMHGGVEVTSTTVKAGPGIAASIEFETKLIDSATESRTAPEYALPQRVHVAHIAGSAAARSALANGGLRAFGGATKVSASDELFTIASTDTMTARAEIAAATTKGAALDALDQYLAMHPGERGTLQVVPVAETVDL